MSSSKRNFTDFKAIPGQINTTTGVYEFPTLRTIDGADRTRLWTIYVRLVKSGKHQKGVDWKTTTETQVPIKPVYFNYGEEGTLLPSSTHAQAWVETGIEGKGFKITRNSPTYFTKPANKNRANQRNAFQQALIYARSQYLKRSERGGRTSSNTTTSGKNSKHFPMLAKPWKDGSKHLKYPASIQPKLDGVRCLCYIPSKDCGAVNVVTYTRTKKDYPNMGYLKNLVYPHLNAFFDIETKQSIFLDGELYRHGKRLQDISGESRNKRKRVSSSAKQALPRRRNDKTNSSSSNTTSSNSETKAIETKETKIEANFNEYHVYDCFYPDELDTAYISRKNQLDEVFKSINADTTIDPTTGLTITNVVFQVATYTVDNEAEAKNKFNQFVSNNYEGAVIRNNLGIYKGHKSSASGTRSNNLVKMKKKFSDEFEVINYTQGTRGKDKGAVIWVCTTDKDQQFNVTPKDMTYEQRYKTFQECEKDFDQKYSGRMMTVEYEDLSKTGVPLRAKAVVFRDYE